MKRVRNVQVIDGAENCTYSVFATTKERFRQLFPKPQDVEFSDDLFARLGKKRAKALLADLWKHPVEKPDVKGIHGTLFFQLEEKKQYYPTKREAEMVALGHPKRVYACLMVFEKDPRVYEKDPGKALVGDWEMPGALQAMREHFAVPDDVPMNMPVGPEDIEAIERYLEGHTIDLARWQYFVEEQGDYG